MSATVAHLRTRSEAIMFSRSRQGAVHVIGGEMPLNAENATHLSNVLEECLRERPPWAVLDLRKVPLLDSFGLETLLDVQDKFTRHVGLLKLAAPNPLCQDILTVTGVVHSFEVYPEVKEAVASFLQ